MLATDNCAYRAAFDERSRVRLVKGDHSQNLKAAILLRALPNPSGLAEHQWYDVRFDDGVYGRFLERYLERIVEAGEEKQKKEAQPQTA